ACETGFEVQLEQGRGGAHLERFVVEVATDQPTAEAGGGEAQRFHEPSSSMAPITRRKRRWARCRRTLEALMVMSSASAISSWLQSYTSLSTTTARWPTGSRSRAALSVARSSARSP